MNKDTVTNDQRKEYISIFDCRICKKIPQKVEQHFRYGERPNDMKITQEDADKLLTTVVEIKDPAEDYCASVTKLLKCPLCGTYYYYNHYIAESIRESGEIYPSFGSDDIVLRRYDPFTALQFLERIAGRGKTPNTIGQFVKVLRDSGPIPDMSVRKDEQNKIAETVKNELTELKGRYQKIIMGITDAIKNRLPDWHVEKDPHIEQLLLEKRYDEINELVNISSDPANILGYAITILCNHFLSEENFEEINRLLLKHDNPRVRINTLEYLVDFGTGNASLIDLAHCSPEIRVATKKYLSEKDRIDEITRMLLDILFSEDAFISGRDMEWGYGYRVIGCRALSVLSVIMSYGADMKIIRIAIPQLVGLLSKHKLLDDYVGRVLMKFIEKRGEAGRKLVIKEIDKLSNEMKAKISFGSYIREYIWKKEGKNEKD